MRSLSLIFSYAGLATMALGAALFAWVPIAVCLALPLFVLGSLGVPTEIVQPCYHVLSGALALYAGLRVALDVKEG